MLKSFSAHHYYGIFYDGHSLDAPYIRLLKPSLPLAIQYYRDKYRFSISTHANLIHFDKLIAQFLKKNSDHKNFRHAFYIGTQGTHATSIIYFSEGETQGFLCADSLGSQVGRFINGFEIIYTQGSSQTAADLIAKVTAIPIYIVRDQRQVDSYSCDIDALVLAKECCGKIQDTYLMPDLVSDLIKSAHENNGYQVVTLNKSLLKLFQTKQNAAELDLQGVIHTHKNKPEVYSQFMKRYGYDISSSGRAIPLYLRIKKIKLVNIIEMQFYMNQLENLLEEKWTAEVRSIFINLAKNAHRNQLLITVNPNRTGLYELSQSYLQICIMTNTNFPENLADISTKHANLSSLDFELIAQSFLDIIQDQDYWKSKTVFHQTVPKEIAAMQKALTSLNPNVTRLAKLNALSLTVSELRTNKSLFRLITGLTLSTNSALMQACYDFFSEDIHNSRSLNLLKSDRDKYQKSLTLFSHRPKLLPSMETYKRPHIRF